MKNKHLLQTLFALCTAALFTTSCTNDALPSPQEGNDNEETFVSFTLGLPLGDEVNYTRADRNDDATEWTIKTLKVYHFSGTNSASADADYLLVAAYNVPIKETLGSGETGMGVCLKSADAAYQLKLSLRSAVDDSKHAFAFVANDSCSTFDAALEKDVTTLEALKACLADKQIESNATSANSTLFMGDPSGLCMTGELKPSAALTTGENNLGPVTMTRIMARMDVMNFVPESRNFKILSVRLKYNNVWGAPKGYLFAAQTANIWTTAAAMEITQNPQYTTSGYLPYGTADYLDESWVGQATIDSRQGNWYKKVLYMYPYPKTLNGNSLPTPTAEVTYTLNGSVSTVKVSLNNVKTGNPFEIKRNYLYTLQVGETSAIGGPITFTFTDAPWTVHEMDADLNGGTTI